MPCIASVIQAPIQSLLRPAMWLPGIKNLHSHKEKWRCDTPCDDILEAIAKAVPVAELNDTRGEKYDVKQIDSDNGRLRVYAYTWANWLDVMEFTVAQDFIEARSFSTGLFPLCIPLAVLLNCTLPCNIAMSEITDSINSLLYTLEFFEYIKQQIFFWAPFYDNKFNSTRLASVRECMDVPVIAEDV